MLRRLLLQNLATIETLEISFEAGFNALTGETGAGKSVLLGGLELALGERASAEILRGGAKTAVAEADFYPADFAALKAALPEIEIEPAPGEPLTLRREFTDSGRSRCFINGQMVGVAELKALGERLVDLHGQHEHQSLFHASAHREALDAFGGHAAELAAYGAAWESAASLRRRARELETGARDFSARLDYLNYQLEEIDELDPQPGELARLALEEKRLAQSDSLREAAAGAYDALYEGDDDAPSVLAQLKKIAAQVEDIAEVEPKFAAAMERLEGARAELADLAQSLRAWAEDLDDDPGALDRAIARAEAIRKLIRKHGGGEDALFTARDAMRAERDGMTRDDAERAEIEKRLGASEKKLRDAGAKLSRARASAAQKLAKALGPLLARLCMERARFDVALEPLVEPGADGMERVEFMLAANPGLPPAPLRKVASGGELSRVMLALKTALAGCGGVGTMVFDEVDAGVSGEAARRVGLLLAGLGASRQVIVITHHAQIASLAARHAVVRKALRGGGTFTEIEPLAGEARIEELARMMGGDAAGREARSLAKALMQAE